MLRLLAVLSAAALAAAPPNVVFVAGDHEYSGEETMPIFASALERQYGMRAAVLHSVNSEGRPDPNGEENIPGLEKLRQADAAVFFLRWRRLPAAQTAEIERYLQSGKPILGLRTSSHAFNYPKGHELERWNAFGELAWGTPPGWNAKGHTHCGHQCSTDVTVAPEARKHAILTGVAPAFHVTSWLYNVLPDYPPAGATVLLTGKPVNPNKPMKDNPVAWTWKNSKGARAFYTSLGHPEDFREESVQRLLINAIHWALGRDVPKKWAGKLPVNVTYHGIRPSGGK